MLPLVAASVRQAAPQSQGSPQKRFWEQGLGEATYISSQRVFYPITCKRISITTTEITTCKRWSCTNQRRAGKGSPAALPLASLLRSGKREQPETYARDLPLPTKPTASSSALSLCQIQYWCRIQPGAISKFILLPSRAARLDFILHLSPLYKGPRRDWQGYRDVQFTLSREMEEDTLERLQPSIPLTHLTYCQQINHLLISSKWHIMDLCD